MPETAIERPLFSVVIPMHNSQGTIRRCLDSVWRQTVTDYEVVVIDDASTDQSRAVVEAQKDRRQRVLFRQTAGPGGYAARNLGVAEARAPWIAFLDADDEWLPIHLAVLRRLMEDFPTEPFLSTSWLKCRPSAKCVRSRFGLALESPRKVGLPEALDLFANGVTPCHTDTVCIRADVFRAIGGFPAGGYERAGDIDTWFRLIEHTRGLVVSPEVTARYWKPESRNYTISRIGRSAGHPLAQTAGRCAEHTHSRTVRRKLRRVSNAAIVSWLFFLKRSGLKVSLESFREVHLEAVSLRQAAGIILVLTLPTPVFSRFIDALEDWGVRGG